MSDVDKYKFLYEYSRAGFEDELQRFRNMEDKAAKFLSFLSIVIVSYTLMIRFSLEDFFPIDSLMEKIICLSVYSTYVGFVSSWCALLRSLAFIRMPRLRLDEQLIDIISKDELSDVYHNISIDCGEAMRLAEISNERKSIFLASGYKDIIFSVVSLCISVVSIVLMNFLK